MRPLFLKFSTNITISFDNNDRDGRIENTVPNVGLYVQGTCEYHRRKLDAEMIKENEKRYY